MNRFDAMVPVPPEETGRGDKGDSLDPAFLESLRLFPIEVQQAFAEVPAGIRKKMFGEEKKHKAKSQRHSSEFMGVLTTEQFMELMEEWAREDRHNRNEWTAEEIEEMDSVRREVITSNTLYDFLKSIAIDEWYQQKPEELAKVMDSLWSNRGKKAGEMNFYRADYFAGIERELEAVNAEKGKIVAALQKLRNQKGHNRIDKKREGELQKQLADKFDVSIGWDGQIHQSIFSSETGTRIGKMEKEVSENKKREEALQTTLTNFVEYMNATDFSIVFSETFDFIFHWIKRRDQSKLQKFYDVIEGWHQKHESDEPLKTSEQVVLSKKQETLIEHFWRTFDSFVRLKKDVDPKIQAQAHSGSAREIATILRFLSK